MVSDRAGGNRVHLLVSSLGVTQYYAAALVVDLVVYLPIMVLTPLLLLAFQFQGAL